MEMQITCGLCSSLCYTRRRKPLKYPAINVKLWVLFGDGDTGEGGHHHFFPPSLCLQYQVFPIQQPVQQQRTEEPTYEVEDGPCTTHSGRPLRLPTFQLTEGERPFLGLVLFVIFFLPPSLPSLSPQPPLGLPFSLSLIAMASPERQRSESAERCMPASPHSTTHSPLTFTACQTNRQACSETCSFARTHGKFGLALLCL